MSSWEEIRFESAGVIGRGLLASLFATTRCRREGAHHYLDFRRSGRPVIFVFWHGQLLPLVHYHRNEGIVVLVSEHADGEYISRVIRQYGFGTVRGSSTRGGVKGLKGLIRAAREGRDLGITPDGPRGPARQFKAGALRAAQVTGLPIIPLSTWPSRAWRLDSWDRFLVPKPFSRIQIVYGPARTVPRRADPRRLEDETRSLQEELDRLTARARTAAGAPAGAAEDPTPTEEG